MDCLEIKGDGIIMCSSGAYGEAEHHEQNKAKSRYDKEDFLPFILWGRQAVRSGKPRKKPEPKPVRAYRVKSYRCFYTPSNEKHQWPRV